MRVFHHPDTHLHAPSLFYRHGSLIGHPEQPARAELLRRAAAEAGHALFSLDDLEVQSEDLAALLRVHDAPYLSFLSEAWSRRDELTGEGKGGAAPDALVATQFARAGMSRKPTGLRGLLGFFAADNSTPILADTWTAAFASARVALAGSRGIAQGLRRAYSLCRPPGHHASRSSAGGFCYLNNTAVAAADLQAHLRAPVAVLDIDVHAGNGTQSIFYSRGDVLTVSIHTDPNGFFPFYAGYADERGEGAGQGANLNLPLAPGADDATWLAALDRALDAIARFGPRAVVLALGLDASRDDPLRGMAVTPDGFEAAGRRIGRLGLPVLAVQEGGYLNPTLGENLKAALAGLEA